MANAHRPVPGGFKSAGVLMVRVRQTQSPPMAIVEALLQVEYNMGTRRCKFHVPGVSTCREGDECEFLHLEQPERIVDERPMNRLTFFGGKREPGEQIPEETAAREFFEELHEMLPRPLLDALIKQGSKHRICALLTHGAFVLHVLEEPRGLDKYDLPAIYASLPPNPPLACATELVWVRFEELLRPAAWNPELGYHLMLTVKEGGAPTPMPISNLVWSTLRLHGPVIARSIVQHITGHAM